MKKAGLLLLTILFVNLVFSQNVGQKGDSKLNYTDINGKKQGKWVKKYPNGKVAYEAYFINDKLVKEYKRYYKSGQLKLEVNYDKNSNGFAKLYWDTKKRMAEGNYVNTNVKDSVWNMYGVDGMLMVSVSYKNGIKDGREIKYYRNGKKSEILEWKNDVRDGIWNWYYDNGKARMKAHHKNGKREGSFWFYHENGLPYIKGKYNKDLRDGKWEFYTDKHKLIKTITYVNGKATNQDELDEEMTKQFEKWEKMKGKIPEPTIESIMPGGGYNR